MSMRTTITVSLLLTTALTVATPLSAFDPEGAAVLADQGDTAPSCAAKCRGLGIEKVKAGDEHCGLLPKERKDTALEAACTLAETHVEELQARAEERARNKCGRALDRPGCRCETELRRWENVYTHILSNRCWTECGWAYVIRCSREPEAGDGKAGSPSPAS